MSRAVPRTPDSCGLLPWELVVALVRIREKASQVPIPRAAARREWIPAASVPGRTRSHQGEDAGPAADPAGISRQVGAERLHHLAASRPKSAPLAPERGSQVLPRRPGWGGMTEKLPTGAPLLRGPGGEGSSGPRLLFWCQRWGTRAMYREGREGGRPRAAPGPSAVGAPFIPLAHPPLRRRDGLIPQRSLSAEGPPPPLKVRGVGPIPTVGGLRRGAGDI